MKYSNFVFAKLFAPDNRSFVSFCDFQLFTFHFFFILLQNRHNEKEHNMAQNFLW